MFIRVRGGLAVLLVVLLGGCTAQTVSGVVTEFDGFAGGIGRLTALVEQHYERAEQLNRQALRHNIDFQMELGSDPEVTTPPLLGKEDRNARRAVLQALNEYAKAVQTSGGAVGTPPAFPDLVADMSEISRISPENFSVEQTLGRVQERDLLATVSGLSMALTGDTALEKIRDVLVTYHPLVEKAGLLLVYDLGSSQDESLECELGTIALMETPTLETLQLCRGGLRGLTERAVKFDLSTRRSRLALMDESDARQKRRKPAIVERILELEEAGRQQDEALRLAQMALMKMIETHGQMKAVLEEEGGNPALAGRGPVNGAGANAFLSLVARAEDQSRKAAPLLMSPTTE
ncbi:hypothetical protein [Sneathiella chinensis]|uniref:Uncharacterized protein n=1 Tax=Sneathiella chinensis TaxID=349750 RepID=A0ABQ5U6M2_9PROT|nr:hypothetical protein [Sneathiella chinensis]GLQ07802.1 hypothetical protein GCM10007924_30240 [Sneathiella chinensis]